MEKIEVCFIRLYPDNPEDALIISGLGGRKRKGEKSRVIKDILHRYFIREQTARPALKSAVPDYSTTSPQQAMMEPAARIPAPAEMPALSEHDKEALKRNLDQLSDMFM